MKNLKDRLSQFAQKQFGKDGAADRFVNRSATLIAFLWVLGMACIMASSITMAAMLFGAGAVALLFSFIVLTVAVYPHRPKNTREGG